MDRPHFQKTKVKTYGINLEHVSQSIARIKHLMPIIEMEKMKHSQEKVTWPRSDNKGVAAS